MNCYDGFRVDCFPENSSQAYGTAYQLRTSEHSQVYGCRPKDISFILAMHKIAEHMSRVI